MQISPRDMLLEWLKNGTVITEVNVTTSEQDGNPAVIVKAGSDVLVVEFSYPEGDAFAEAYRKK